MSQMVKQLEELYNMFTDKDQNYITSSLYTTQFLGSEKSIRHFLDLVLQENGVFLPEKWGSEERCRHLFMQSSLQEIVEQWLAPEKSKYIFFERRKPVALQMWFFLERHRRAKFNEFHLLIRDRYFKADDKYEELLSFISQVANLIKAEYGLIAHIRQEQRQSPILTPAERLPGIYWANFFGKPYIDFLGRHRLLATPCFKVAEVNDHLLLLLTNSSPLNSEMVESDAIADKIKRHLNPKAFAGPNFPDEPCEVPEFDFSDLRIETVKLPRESSGDRLAKLKSELEIKGYRPTANHNGKLIFKDEDGATIAIDTESGEVSIDTTGVLL